MSLDVYLTVPKEPTFCFCSKCGHEHQDTTPREVYSANITHNLTEMADAVGLYKPLWRPDEIGITKAKHLIAPLTDGLVKLIDGHEDLIKFNPSNGWGSYDGLVDFVDRYLSECRRNPEADVRVSR